MTSTLQDKLTQYGFPEPDHANMTGDWFSWRCKTTLGSTDISVQRYNNIDRCIFSVHEFDDSRRITTDSDWIAVASFIKFLKGQG